MSRGGHPNSITHIDTQKHGSLVSLTCMMMMMVTDGCVYIVDITPTSKRVISQIIYISRQHRRRSPLLPPRSCPFPFQRNVILFLKMVNLICWRWIRLNLKDTALDVSG